MVSVGRRRCTRREAAGFFIYRPGNILLVHVDMIKTNIPRATKRRATFNRLAEFIGYEHGNVCCKVLEKQITEGISLFWKRPIIIPIYYTKYVCATLADLPFFHAPVSYLLKNKTRFKKF
jgi:hypothetical protein